MTPTDLPTDAVPGPAEEPERRLALRLLTVAAVVGCALLFYPVLAGVTWGLAFAVVAAPLHRRLAGVMPRWLGGEAGAAVVGTAAVALALLLPVALVIGQLVSEGHAVARSVEGGEGFGEWRETLRAVPQVGPWLAEQAEAAEPEKLAREGLSQLGRVALPVAAGSGAFALQSLIALFVLFFALLDGPRLAAAARGLLPVTEADAGRLLARAADAVRATLAGTLFVGVVQGATGGVMFWLLGLPGAVLWGVVMAVVSVLPVLGAFLVWLPAAVYLATHERLLAAAALVAWGVAMAGPVSNFLYARLAGDRMGLHPAVALLAFVGGLALFGVSGMVLGPVLAVTAAELLAMARRPHRATAA